MRRALPWLLVALLAVGAAAGAGLGVATGNATPTSAPAGPELARIVAATRAAGTADFSFSEIVTSRNPALRSAGHGQGLVNFATHSLRVAQENRETTYSGTSTTATRAVTQESVVTTIWIGRTQYLQFRLAGRPHGATFMKESTPSKETFGAWGPLDQYGPLGQLDFDMSVPGLRLADQGPTEVRGVSTTRYLLVVPTCPVTRPAIATASTRPMELWVDGHGRLVQARLSVQVDFTKATLRADHVGVGGTRALGSSPGSGRVTEVSTIELGAFGTPAAISAPPVIHSVGGSEVGVALARRTCP